MLILDSPRRDATRAISPGRCGSLTWTTSASVQVTRSVSRAVLAVVGLSATKRVTAFPPMGNEYSPRMFTLRSASARQTLPSVPGRSSIKTVNSLVTGIGDLLFLTGNAERILGLV